MVTPVKSDYLRDKLDSLYAMRDNARMEANAAINNEYSKDFLILERAYQAAISYILKMAERQEK